MLKYNLLIAWRRILRNRMISSITVFGLAAGIAACILIFLFVDTEMHYDTYWKDADRLYRITETIQLQDKTDPFALTSFSSGNDLKNQIPEFEAMTRLLPIGEQTVWQDAEVHTVKEAYFAEQGFFDLFDFPFEFGNPKTALAEPKSAVLTKETSERIFGQENPIGKMIRSSRNTYQITGVIDVNRFPSHLRDFEILFSMGSMSDEMRQGLTGDYMRMAMYTYVKLTPDANSEQVDKKISAWSDRVVSPWLTENGVSGKITFRLQSVEDIHFDTYYTYDLVRKGNFTYVIIFGCVAVFLLLIACFNFMNLNNAQAIKRAKEIAVKKVAGAGKWQIAKQFIGESAFLTGIAFIISIACVELLLPGFNAITNNTVSLFASLSAWRFWLVILIMLLITALAGGGYSAFFLSALQPVDVFKSAHIKSRNLGKASIAQFFSKGLVVLQFTISVSIIVATILVLSQLDFLRNHENGFEKENTIVLRYPIGDTTWMSHASAIRHEFEQTPGIRAFASSDHAPGDKTGRLLFYMNINGKEETRVMNICQADYAYTDFLHLEIKSGRWFSKEYPSDIDGAFVINEACARDLGLENPIGLTLKNGYGEGKIIGVVKDFNYASLKEQIEPLVFSLSAVNPENVIGRTLLLKVDENQAQKAISHVQTTWKSLFPNYPFSYTMLEDSLDAMYEKEEIMLQVLGYFALLTIVISCLGLFALSAYATEKRNKEIGIRKVMGASVIQIIVLILKEFLALVFIAILLAIPMTWYVMNQWLESFAYHISISIWVFIATGFFAMIIATITVGIRATMAAIADPVKSLRYE